MNKLTLFMAVLFSFLVGYYIGVKDLANSAKTSESKINSFEFDSLEFINNNINMLLSKNDNAIEMYKNFLNGDRSIGEGNDEIDIHFLTTPTGEPDKHYSASYAIIDTNGDGVPELHIKSAKYYYILSCTDIDLSVWKILSPYDYPLKNSAFLYRRYGNGYEIYNYYMTNFYGEDIWEIGFEKHYDDENERYSFAGIEISKDVWLSLTETYLAVGLDEIEWVTIFDITN